MRRIFTGALMAGLTFSTPAQGAETRIEYPDRQEVEDTIPTIGESLTGRQIYERSLENRQVHSAVLFQHVISRDPGGGEQYSRFWVRYKDLRDKDGEPDEWGVVAKTVVKLKEPPDMRGTGFLIIVNAKRDPDQFVYRPTSRTVRRVHLSDVSIAGTDFSFGDIAFENIEKADYVRLPDAQVDGIPTFVVEATMKPLVESTIRTTRTWIEKDHYVALRALYMDDNGVVLKEMNADPLSIKEFEGLWIPTNTTVTNVREGTSTIARVEDVEVNPELSERLFSTFRLQLNR